MKTVDSDNESVNLGPSEFLIQSRPSRNLIRCEGDLTHTYDVLKSTPIEHKGKFYQKVLLKRNVTQDLRSISLPHSLEEKNKCNGNVDINDSCDTNSKLLNDHDSPPESPVSDNWFRTWPERYEKIRTDSSPDHSMTNGKPLNGKGAEYDSNTPRLSNKRDKNNTSHDIVTLNGNVPKLTLNEALQNISLAYSPITKQLHLLESKSEPVETPEENNSSCKKTGHHRTDAGSFSSTISSLSEPSPSGSLLENDDASSVSDDLNLKSKKKGLSSFFTR